MTRNKQALLEGMKNNLKLDKDKIEKKKIIMIPQIIDIQKQYYSMVSHTEAQFSKLRERNPCFIRFFDIQERFPKEEVYEADEMDVKFLQSNFPKELPENLTQRELIKNPVLMEFENVIVYLEETEDQNFKNYNQNHYKFSLA